MFAATRGKLSYVVRKIKGDALTSVDLILAFFYEMCGRVFRSSGKCFHGTLKIPDPLRFEVLFDAIKRALENFAHSQPYTLSQHYVQLLLSDKFWSKEQLLAVCKGKLSWFLKATFLFVFLGGLALGILECTYQRLSFICYQGM